MSSANGYVVETVKEGDKVVGYKVVDSSGNSIKDFNDKSSATDYAKKIKGLAPSNDATRKLLETQIPAQPEKVTYGKINKKWGFPKDKASYVYLSDGTKITSKKGSANSEVRDVRKKADAYVAKRNKAIKEWTNEYGDLMAEQEAAKLAEQKRIDDWVNSYDDRQEQAAAEEVAEAKRIADEEAAAAKKAAEEAEAKRIADEEAAALKAAEEAEAKRKAAEAEAAERARLAAEAKAAEDARLKAELEAKLKAEEEARAKAAEEARIAAELEAKRRAEEEAARVAAEQEQSRQVRMGQADELGSSLVGGNRTRTAATVQDRMYQAPTTNVIAGGAFESAVSPQAAYLTDYTGTPGNINPDLVTTQPGMDGSYKDVAYTNQYGAQIMVTEQNGMPVTAVPPGFTKGAADTDPIARIPELGMPGWDGTRYLAEGGSVKGGDTQTEALFTIAKMNGYKGPQSSTALKAFFNSSDALKAKARAIGVAMANGGYVKLGYADGGAVPDISLKDTFVPQAQDLITQTMAVQQPTVSKIAPTAPDFIPSDAGQLTPTANVQGVSTVRTTAQAMTPEKDQAATYTAAKSEPGVNYYTSQLQPAQGEVSQEAQVQAQEGSLSPDAKADAARFDPKYIDSVFAGKRNVTTEELAQAQGLDEEAVKAKIAQTNVPENIRAAQTTVRPEELPQPAQIKEAEMAQAQAITMSGLTTDATAVAAKLDKFSLDAGTLADFKEGKIEAQDTVQGQLSQLMKDFDDGTPAWAAGAMRAANAAMAARGMGGSSMAAAAITQAAMESAIPIAQADAQAFQTMKLDNLNRQQQISLANAAAQQGVELANFNAEQQAALQNSQNAFSLQSQNLSNMQQTMLANAQIKSALQGQNLSNQQQSNVAIAARFAEASNLNLSNRQQAVLQGSQNNLQVDLANLSSKQQSYITNAQLEAALQGKTIDNQQQVAIGNAARFSEANNLTFTAQQQAQLHNSELMKTVGLSNLNAKQAATLQNAAQIASMDMANLSNRQQAAVQNAQSFLQMDMTNLSNEQQTAVFKAQQNIQALFTDQAATNAALQFNASSDNQTDQFFANLAQQASTFNASQQNAMSQFNVDSVNSMRQFNAGLQEQRDSFNAQNGLVVAQANANWRQQIATINTAAQNQSNTEFARTMNGMTAANLDQYWQRERDIMSFVFTSAENTADRLANIIMQESAAATAAEIADEKGRGQLVATLTDKLADWGLSKIT